MSRVPTLSGSTSFVLLLIDIARAGDEDANKNSGLHLTGSRQLSLDTQSKSLIEVVNRHRRDHRSEASMTTTSMRFPLIVVTRA